MDNTRLFLFAALVFIGMLLWQQWQADYGPQTQPQSVSQQQQGNNANDTGAAATVDDLPDLADSVDGGQTQSGSAAADGAVTSSSSQQLVQVDTDVLQVLIDPRGGVVRSIKLKQFPT